MCGFLWSSIDLAGVSGSKRLETGLTKSERKKKTTNLQNSLLCEIFFIVKQDKLVEASFNIIVALLCNNYYHFLVSPLLFLVSIITPAERPKLCCYYFKAISTPTSSRT